MRTCKALMVAVWSLLGASGCDIVFGLVPGELNPTFSVSGTMTEDTIWTADRSPVLEDFVRVPSGVTLTIEAGTRILAENGGALFIDRGARIVAKGTADAPIVFTSKAKSRTMGDWRGIFLCGKAPVNGAPNGDFLMDSVPTGSNLTCGGNEPNDSSGELHYVRIEFSGSASGAGTNAAGLELAGVGTGTLIDHLQVHRTSEDGVNIYGGGVSLKYVLITDHREDGLNWLFGWQGKVQFLAVARSIDGIEAGDEDGDSYMSNPAGNLPSNPTIYNATLIGVPSASASSNTGLELEHGTKGQLYNLLVADFNDYAVILSDDETRDNAIAKTLDIRNSIFSNSANFLPGSMFPDGWRELTWLIQEDPTRMNQALPKDKHGIRSLDAMSLDLSLNPGAPGLSGAATPPNDGFFDPTVTFIGACGESCPEFTGWTSFPVQ